MSVTFIGPEVEARLDWIGLSDAIEAAHSLPRAQVSDSFLYRGADTLLNRSAWIDGFGLLVKVVTVNPGNGATGLPAVNGAVNVMDDATGQLEAMIDFHLLTKWKTAGDSLLAARKLARPDARRFLICGAGNVARSMVAAYRAAFPQAEISIWNRTHSGAQALADAVGATAAPDLAEAVAGADVIATTTMATEPYLRGDWISPGTHLDLIGAYRPDMREVDDVALQKARVFCDARATTVHHIGEFRDPIARGVLREEDIVADYYDLPSGRFARQSADEITISKNGGGAHLDLMTARYILSRA